MGGYGSGRRSIQKRKLNECLSLDINFLVKKRAIFPDRHIKGSLEWKRPSAATMGYEADLTTDSPFIRLYYALTDKQGNVQERFDTIIQLAVTVPHFGGKRYWFICPRTGEKASKLYMHDGYFISRKATGLAYESQSLPKFDRVANRKWRIGDKIHDPVTKQMRRPKGMHFKTYYRLMHGFSEAHRDCALLIPIRPNFFDRFPGKFPFH